MINKRKNKLDLITIAQNKRIYLNFFIEEELEAGLVLKNWEIKALRARKVSILSSYITLKNGEAFLFGANFTPLTISSDFYIYDPVRTRKLLLNKNELNLLYSRINRKSYALVTLSLYWKNAWCKVKIGIAKGKTQYDKRSLLKERAWQLDKARIMKNTGC